MKTLIASFVLLTIEITTVFGQKSYDLYQADSISKTYVARDYIWLHPGYSFNSAGGKTLHLTIDEHMLESTSYQNILQLPNTNRSINTDYAVGTITGEASVSTNGAAVYQIPIEVVPGTGSMQPNISVNYNSQTGNGLLGYGWGLGAVSAITRVGSTIYQDSLVRCPNLTDLDNIMLDGQRLLRTSGNNLAESSTYRTEVETYIEVTCKTLNSYLGFELKNKEGWTLQYGSSEDSYVMPKGGSAAYAWLLKKATDANGNYMIYTYDNDATSGEFRLKQIEYTGNDSVNPVINPYNKIEFFYETRTDTSTSYIAGNSVKQSVILYKIRCSSYGSTIREYKFNYYYDGFYSKLTEVEEYGQDGMRYNSTIVDWGDSDNSVYAKYAKEYTTSLSDDRDINYPLYEDFNGDGKTDFISYPNKSSYSSSDVATLFLSTYINDSVHFVKKCTIPLVSGFVGFLTADLNGDGLKDLVRIRKNGSTYRYEYFLSLGTSFRWSVLDYFDSASSEAFVGDFDGDGKDEILTKSESELHNEFGKVVAKGGIDWGTIPYEELYSLYQQPVDFNGDGKTDMFVSDPSGYRIYEVNGFSFSLLFSGSEVKNTATIDYLFFFGDFNGDGNTDILVKKEEVIGVIEYFILLSTGTGFEKKALPDLNGTGKLFTCDLNRDGKTDIVICSQNNGYAFPLKVGLFDGVTFQFENYDSNLITQGNMNQANSWKYLHFSDFDGDGFAELCYSMNKNTLIIKSFKSKQKLLVKNIINGLNQKTSFYYSSIANDTTYYETSTSPDPDPYPICKFQQPLYVVNLLQQLNSSEKSYYFRYKGARIHKHGKGFLGFEEVTKYNALQERAFITKYKYASYYFCYIYPEQQIVITIRGDSILCTDYQWGFTPTCSTPGKNTLKVWAPFLGSQTTKDFLTGLTKTIEYEFYLSDNGNPSKITETQGNLITETNYIWEVKGSSPFKNRVTQEIINQKGIGSEFSETKKFEYDAKARLTKKTDYYGNAKAITTDYSSYDTFGNLKTVTTSAANCPTVTVNSIFDATGRFLETSTDALGNVSTARYDAQTGMLLEKTDITGLKTTYQYDGFQRLRKELSPIDSITYSITWDISGENLYKTMIQSIVSGVQTSWYNALGQEIKRQIPGFSGAVVSEKTYNSLGQLYRSFLPGYGSKSSQYIQYDYDYFGRLQSENNLGRITTYTYNNLTTTVTAPDGNTRSTTLNLSGLVENSKDEAGNTVAYTYNSLGKPETIIAAGATTYIKYDDRGFQRVLKDVNMTDSAKYVYDAYGQLTSQTNARGQTTSFLYDVAGRITQESCPERTLTYQYVPSGNGIGQIQTVKQGNAIVRSYGYTPLGQLSSLTEKIDNADYTTNYSYNALGQMQEQQSPSGMRTSYRYNSNGLLTSMRNAENNNLLWQLDAANAMGQITESTLGNGLKRFSGYDAYYSPNQLLLKNGNLVIDQVDYNFNSTTGNLTSRNDVSNGKNETFGYDNLNRLTSLTLNGGNANSISYYPNGNINAKTDVGTYQYDKGNHAVSGITNLSPSYNPSAFDISNTSYNRVSSLSLQGSIIKELDFQYNPDNQRNKSLYYEGNTLKKTMYYVGNYEKEVISGGSTKECDYIYMPEGLSAIAVKTNGTRSLYYVQTDHLGSIRLVTDASKIVQTRYYYDAWGKQTLASGTSITNRGYIGEEHLNDFGLLNLNARLYDPVLGRFLEMDPYVQMPDYTQSYNRYLYGMNNPLKYSDPNGEFIFTLICIFVPGMQVFLPVAIAADVAWMSNYATQVVNNYAHGYKGSDAWLGQVDWFDVGASAVFGGASVYVPWIKYAEPWVTNAVDIKGNGDVITIFGSNRDNPTKNFGMYVGNSLLEDGSMLITDVVKNEVYKGNSKNVSLNKIGREDLFKKLPKEFGKNLLWDLGQNTFSTLGINGFNNEYNGYLKRQQQDPYPYSYPTYNPQNINYFPANDIQNSNNKQYEKLIQFLTLIK